MSVTADYPLLTSIDNPADLRQLPEPQLVALANELRQYLIHTVAQSGGHFAAGLGAVELTLALHYVFDTPEDRLVWDVGHQAYPHKILTGRRERLGTIRQLNGLAPFPKRTESPYDTFGVGHSSTSISAALGMAIAAQQQGSDRRAVAIIGDGGMTAGMAFEALNHAGDLKADVLVILNDNEMSISPNVGAVSSRLTKMLSGRILTNAREGGKQVLRLMPTPMWELARRAEAHVKGMLVPGILFEEFGFNYFGPVDGHDLPLLVQTLRNLRQQHGPRLLHILTRKGKGYERAEAEPVAYHGVSRFDPTQGLPAKKTDNLPTYTQVFGEWLCDIAERDHRVVGVTPAMCEGSGMVKFSQRFPDRYFDVGIAEQHSVTVAAGMACDGLKPVVAIYSTFLQRAYDQLLHDIAIQNLPVLFAIDRAGLVGPDGQTHAGSFDLSYLRCIPNMVIMTPADENETRQMLYTGYLLDGPTAVRYPRCKAVGVEIQQAMTALPLGKAERRRQGQSGVALLAFGPLLEIAEALAEEFDASVVNMRFVKPLDETLVLEIATEHDVIVTLEENAIMGGAGSAVSECLAAHGIAKVVRHIGLPDRYIDQGTREQVLAAAGLDIDSVRQRLQQWTHNVVTGSGTE